MIETLLQAIADAPCEPALSPPAIGPDAARIAALHDIPSSVLQVVNSRSKTVHLYTSGSWTSCGNFMCGSPRAGWPAAEFGSWDCNDTENELMFCSNCYSNAGMVRVGAKLSCSDQSIDLASPLFDLPASDSSSSSSSSSEDS